MPVLIFATFFGVIVFGPSANSQTFIKQKLDGQIVENWDNQAKTWVNYWKFGFTYDNNGNNTEALNYAWDTVSNTWGVYEKLTYAYSADGKNTEWIQYKWSPLLNNWEGMSKYVPTYDANMNIPEEIYYFWDAAENTWVNSSKNINTFDSVGKLTATIRNFWNPAGKSWVNSSKSVMTYDVNGNISENILFYWSSGMNNWANMSRQVYSFDVHGKCTEEVDYRWVETTGTWINDSRYAYLFDADMNLSESHFYRWDASGSKWLNYYYDVSTYDNTYSYSDLIIPYYYGDTPYNHMLTQLVSYEFDGNEWVSLDKWTFHYTEVNLAGISENPQEYGIEAFPNPASEYVTFRIKGAATGFTAEVFDIQGKKCLSQESWNGRPVSIKYLPKGLYMYRLTNPKISFSGKLLID